MLPKLAEGDANKVFVMPSEFTQAFAGIGDALARDAAAPGRRRGAVAPAPGPRRPPIEGLMRRPPTRARGCQNQPTMFDALAEKLQATLAASAATAR